jgi:hypothetical protein
VVFGSWPDSSPALSKLLITNLLLPMIFCLQELKHTKPPIKDNFVSSIGDITVEQFVFAQSFWCTLVLRIVNNLNALLEVLFQGQDWKKIIDPSFLVCVLM